MFVIDDRNWDYPSYWASVAATATNYGGMGAMIVGGPPPLPTNAWTNSSGGGGVPSYAFPMYLPDDLYLTNFALANGTTAEFVIHQPSNITATNGMWDVFYTTNLAPPISWQWVLTNAPGLTTLYVTNATNAQGFYTIGFPSAGTDFWLAFMNTEQEGRGSYMLYISSQVATSGTVCNPSVQGTGFTNNFTLMPGTVTNIIIPNGVPINPDFYDETTPNYAIHVMATLPVSVYALNHLYAASWAFSAYPTPMLGTNYRVMARPALDDWYYGHSQFAIVATVNNTTVWITPSTNANLLAYSGGTYSNTYPITMNQGDAYQIYSSSNTDDVTGTLIRSTSPIAVFAGANDAYVPATTNGDSNPLCQEQLPLGSWGNQALALCFGRPGGDSYRVLAATDDTTLTTTTSNGVVTNNLVAGQFLDTILDGWVEFQANNPIQVAQFAQGGKSDYDDGDPCEMLLPPTGRYLSSYTIAIPPCPFPEGGGFNNNFLNLIVPQSAITNTFVNDEPLTNLVAISNFVAITNSGYWAARLSVPAGTNYTINSSQPLEVQVYGFADSAYTGFDDAYCYIGGFTVFP